MGGQWGLVGGWVAKVLKEKKRKKPGGERGENKVARKN